MASIQLQKGLVIICVALYIVAIPLIIYKIEPYSTYEADSQVTLLFTAYLVLFAVIEGYSTYMQVVQNERRYGIEDARNELAVAYGPLYGIIMSYQQLPPDFDPYRYWFTWKDKEELDRIFSSLPFMFPEDLYSYWKTEVQNLDPEIINLFDSVEHRYDISVAFKKKFMEEYEKRVNEYYRLIGKG